MHLRRPWQRRLVRPTLRSADAVVAVSPGLRDEMRMLDPDLPIRVVGNVTDTDFFTPAPKADQQPFGTGTFRFASIALLTSGKDMGTVLQAFRRARESGPRSVELVIGGDGPERVRLEALAERLGLGDACRFVGRLTPAGVRDLLQASDVFVLASRHETFGVVLAEAMACGKPVIATRCGGPEWFVTPESGVLVPVGDPSALADAMIGVMRGTTGFDPNAVRRHIVGRFGPEAFLEAIEHVYASVVP
jgi:glycosyltransferase involved in cell wall biosynthesis